MMNRVEINEEMTAPVNGGTFTPNKFYESQYNACGIEVRTHFIDPDEFVLPDGRITNADEANRIVAEKFGTPKKKTVNRKYSIKSTSAIAESSRQPLRLYRKILFYSGKIYDNL